MTGAHVWEPFYHTVEADKNQPPADRLSQEMQRSQVKSFGMRRGRTQWGRRS